MCDMRPTFRALPELWLYRIRFLLNSQIKVNVLLSIYNGLSKGHPTDDILAGEQIYYNYLIIKIIFVADCLTRLNSVNG